MRVHERYVWPTIAGIVLATFIAGLSIGCGGRLAAPPQLAPAGAAAFHADRVIRGISALQDVAINGEAQQVIATPDARAILQATEIAGKAGIELATALRAGLSADTAKGKAIATIRQALQSVPQQLSAGTRTQIEPYVSVVLVALTVLE